MSPRRLVLLSALLLAACDAQPPPAPPARDTDGRAETRGIRNTEAVGYAGDAVADRVDAALSAQAQRTRQLDEQLDSQGEDAP